MPSPVGIVIKRPAVSAAWYSSVSRTISFEALDYRSLLMDRQLRVTDNVCEQHMGDLKLDLFLDLGRHVPMLFIHILPCSVEQIKIDNRTLRGVARYQPGRRRRLK